MENTERRSFLQHRREARKSRGRGKYNADTVALEQSLIEQGYRGVTEMAFMLANDTFDNIELIEEKFGTDSVEYKDAVAAADKAIKTALPYFATQRKSIEVEDKTINEDTVEEELRKILNKTKTVDSD